MHLTRIVIQLPTLLPADLRAQDLLAGPPEPFQLCLLQAASPLLFRMSTRKPCLSDETAASRGLKDSLLGQLDLLLVSHVLAFLPVRHLINACTTCHMVNFCVSQPAYLRAASKGVLQASDPYLVTLLRDPALRQPATAAGFQRGKERIPSAQECRIWPESALELLSRPFQILSDLAGRPIHGSSEGLTEADRRESSVLREGQDLLEALGELPDSSLQLRALHVISTARRAMQAQRGAMKDLAEALEHLSSPQVRLEIAILLRACLDVNQVLSQVSGADQMDQGQHARQGEEGPQEDSCGFFSFESLATLEGIKSRFHPHYCLRDVITALFRERLQDLDSQRCFGASEETVASVSCTLVEPQVTRALQVIRNQLEAIVTPLRPNISDRGTSRAQRPRGVPSLASTSTAVQEVRRAISVALSRKAEMQVSSNTASIMDQDAHHQARNNLQRYNVLLSFLDYELQDLEEIRLQVVARYIALREYFQGWTPDPEKDAHLEEDDGEKPPVLSSAQVLKDSPRSRENFNCLLNFLQSVAGVFDTAPFAQDEAIQALRRYAHQQFEPAPPVNLPARSHSGAPAMGTGTSKPEPQSGPRDPTLKLTKVKQRIQSLEQAFQRRSSSKQAAAPAADEGGGSETAMASNHKPAPSARERPSLKAPLSTATPVKGWHWKPRAASSPACTPPVFQLAYEQPSLRGSSGLLSPGSLPELLLLKPAREVDIASGGKVEHSADAEAQRAIPLRLLFTRGTFVGMDLVRGGDLRTVKQHFTNLDFSGLRPGHSTIVVGDKHKGSSMCFRRV